MEVGQSATRLRATVAAAVLLLAPACSGPGQPAADGSRKVAQQEVALPSPSADLVISPADGSDDVSPDVPVRVRASAGRLTGVTVTGPDGELVPGDMLGQGSEWTSREPLRFSSAYTVTASVAGADGSRRRETAGFRTVTPRRLVDVSVAPLDGETVGVGMPVVVYFDEPVRDKAAVERRLEVRSTPAVQGAWHWFSDTEVHYRPRTFWPAGADVTVHLPLAGVQVSRGVWSDENRRVSFDVGPSMVSVVDVERHRMVVHRNGEVVRRVPVSTGKASFLTRNGTKVVLEKHRVKIMDASTIGISPGSSEYYRLRVEYALRVTWSGEFVHSAPWSVGSQGRANVSHGCVGMAPVHARWLFDKSHRGDVVRVVNSPRPLEKGNGFTDWNLSWEQWRDGSALPG